MPLRSPTMKRTKCLQTVGLRVFHWWGMVPLAPDSGELHLGKLNAPDGEAPQARASAGCYIAQWVAY